MAGNRRVPDKPRSKKVSKSESPSAPKQVPDEGGGDDGTDDTDREVVTAEASSSSAASEPEPGSGSESEAVEEGSEHSSAEERQDSDEEENSSGAEDGSENSSSEQRRGSDDEEISNAAEEGSDNSSAEQRQHDEDEEIRLLFERKKAEKKLKKNNGGKIDKRVSNGKVSRGKKVNNGKNSLKKAVVEEESDREEGTACKFPMSRIYRIMKDLEGYSKLSQEAIFLTNKASEKFLELYSKEAYASAYLDRKSQISYDHLASVVSKRERFNFLSDIVPERVKAENALADLPRDDE